MENTKNASLSKLIPVMLCFFAMGFVDLVGIASNYVKADLGLTDSQANIFPSLVFILLIISRIMLVLFAIALLLRLCELTSQLILLHSIDFVIAILLIAFVLSTLCFASFFFGSSL